jgi:hypothetical protein
MSKGGGRIFDLIRKGGRTIIDQKKSRRNGGPKGLVGAKKPVTQGAPTGQSRKGRFFRGEGNKLG